jgi:hypothetical protein
MDAGRDNRFIPSRPLCRPGIFCVRKMFGLDWMLILGPMSVTGNADDWDFVGARL